MNGKVMLHVQAVPGFFKELITARGKEGAAAGQLSRDFCTLATNLYGHTPEDQQKNPRQGALEPQPLARGALRCA
eukprot:6464996-Amphidinium_carterae.1